MNINPVWRTCERFTVLEAGYLLAELEPGPPTDDIPPAVVVTLQGLLRIVDWDTIHPMSSDDRKYLKPRSPRMDWPHYVVTEHGEPVTYDLISTYIITRSECLKVAKGLGLHPQFLKPADEKDELTANEKRELGRLRIEKKKWVSSLEAAVSVTIKIVNGDIGNKRKEVMDHLNTFHLPDTTNENIWQALRNNNLTPGPGRPNKSNR